MATRPGEPARARRKPDLAAEGVCSGAMSDPALPSMPRPPFPRAAALFFAAGAIAWATGAAASASGMPPPAALPDPLHLWIGGTGGSLVGHALLTANPRLAPDPDGRKGPAPRAFWTLVLGVLCLAFAAPHLESGPPVADAFAVAGALLEAAAAGMLLLGNAAPRTAARSDSPQA